MHRNALALGLALIPAAAVSAQSINIDFGLPENGPSSSYAAAGLPGVWNSIEGEHTPFQDPEVIYDLVDVSGNPTGAYLYQFGGQQLINNDDITLSGDDAIFLEDGLVTHSTGLEVCIWIEGLENGEYEVLMYGLMPNHPETLTKIRHDFNPPNVNIGGAWPGQHEEFVTYSRHIITVTNGKIGSHAGIPSGGDTLVGSILNGVQLRRIIFGDLNGDGLVGFTDLVGLLSAWGPCPAKGTCSADLDEDGDVGFSDLIAMLSAWD